MDFTTLISFLLGGSVLGFIEFLLRRYDSKNDRFAEVVKELAQVRADIKQIEEKEDRRAAVTARVRILNFNDELQEGRLHSKDSYDQVLSDITEYETFCGAHPNFKNNQTAITVNYINRSYAERLEKHDFLGGVSN